MTFLGFDILCAAPYGGINSWLVSELPFLAETRMFSKNTVKFRRMLRTFILKGKLEEITKILLSREDIEPNCVGKRRQATVEINNTFSRSNFYDFNLLQNFPFPTCPFSKRLNAERPFSRCLRTFTFLTRKPRRQTSIKFKCPRLKLSW